MRLNLLLHPAYPRALRAPSLQFEAVNKKVEAAGPCETPFPGDCVVMVSTVDGESQMASVWAWLEQPTYPAGPHRDASALANEMRGSRNLVMALAFNPQRGVARSAFLKVPATASAAASIGQPWRLKVAVRACAQQTLRSPDLLSRRAIHPCAAAARRSPPPQPQLPPYCCPGDAPAHALDSSILARSRAASLARAPAASVNTHTLMLTLTLTLCTGVGRGARGPGRDRAGPAGGAGAHAGGHGVGAGPVGAQRRRAAAAALCQGESAH
jgi:hypothetical protein